ncbi:MAG: hypothetical protein HYU39_02915 [Thaumarchaeota archaeon]|nr:hypothetical protein [Nitrososphaerota archaeon]
MKVSPNTERLPVTPFLILAFLLMSALAAVPNVLAQAAPTLTVEKPFVNLGMETSIIVKAPAAGTYTVVITKPDGKTQVQADYSFAQAGEAKQIYGNATLGFKSIIDKTGTYKVSLQSQSKQVAETTLFATDKLDLDVTVANAGTTDNVCYLSNQFTRGTSIIPRIYIRYASTGEYVTAKNAPNTVATFNMPNGTKMVARFAAYLPPEGAWRNCFRPNWNDYAGVWNIVAEAQDGKGNYGKYESYPQIKSGANVLRFGFEVIPAPLTVTPQIIDAATGKPATTALKSGQNLRIEAKVTYDHPLGPLGRETAVGYIGLLNASRGGVVIAKLGWGFYNQTSKSFGGSNQAKNPGGLIANVPLSYDQASGRWTGTYAATGSEPKGDYLLIVDSRDSASPPNTGIGTAKLAPPVETVEKVVEKTTTTTVEKTATATVEKPVDRFVEKPVQITSEIIPLWAYGVMGALLVVGVVVGRVVWRKK